LSSEVPEDPWALDEEIDPNLLSRAAQASQNLNFVTAIQPYRRGIQNVNRFSDPRSTIISVSSTKWLSYIHQISACRLVRPPGSITPSVNSVSRFCQPLQFHLPLFTLIQALPVLHLLSLELLLPVPVPVPIPVQLQLPLYLH